MSDDHSSIMREIAQLREDLHDITKVNTEDHNEVFTRVRSLELALATAKGAKAGVIFSFSCMWAILLAGLAALWK